MTSDELWAVLSADWPTTVKTVVGAGLGTLLAQWLVPVLHDRRKQRSQAAFMAMRLAVVLEAYASACTNLIMENDHAETPPDQAQPDWDTRMPELPGYPEHDDGWRALDRRLASKALDLRNRIAASQGLIYSTIEYDEDALGETLRDQISARGLEAWAIASGLRRQHKVEMADPVWDYAQHLRGTASKVAARKRQREDHLELRAAQRKTRRREDLPTPKG